MRDRIAKLLIALAAVLILADFAWVFPRLASLLLEAVRRSPEMLLLASALGLLVAAWVVRPVRRAGERRNSGDA